MTERHWFTDVASGNLEPTAGELVVEDSSFDPREAETVTIDSPWNRFFGTDEYVTFEGTVAQPIVQPYFYDGELHLFKKDEEELKDAQAQIDNLPWTTGHPPKKIIESSEQIKGFWQNPEWNDGQMAKLFIPANDPDAVRFAVHNDELSIGFRGGLDWVDGANYDAVQRNLAYGHIASVENGRCSKEDGCALHTDDMDEGDSHGHVMAVDDVGRSMQTESPDDSAQFDEGDWVAFTTDGDTVYGQVTYADSERALVREYDIEDETLATEATAVKTDSLREWAGPQADSCGGTDCNCGLHDTPSDQFTDAPDGIYSTDGEWYAIGPDEHTKDSTKYTDDAMFPVGSCSSVEDAWTLSGKTKNLKIEQSTLEARIKRAADAQDCPKSQRPWTDGAQTDEQQSDSTSMSDNDIKSFIDEHNLDAQDVIDALDLEVPDDPTAFYDGEPDVDALAEDFDAVDLLVDKKEDLEAKVETLNDELHEYRKEAFADRAEDLAELTNKWGDEEELIERFEDDEDEEFTAVDDLDAKIELVEDIKGEETTTVDSEGEGEEKDEPDVPTTSSGRFDLRQNTKLD